MPQDVKISELPAVTSLTGTESVPIVVSVSGGVYTGRANMGALTSYVQGFVSAVNVSLINEVLSSTVDSWVFAENGARSGGAGISDGQFFFQREGTGPGDRRGAAYRVQGEADAENRVGMLISSFSPDATKFPIVFRCHVDDGVRTSAVPVGASRSVVAIVGSATILPDGTQGIVGSMTLRVMDDPLANGGVGCGGRWEINLTERTSVLPSAPTTMIIDSIGVTWKGSQIWDADGVITGAGPPPNYLTNPAFLHWQRGTSFAVGASTTHLADRWKSARSLGGYTISRQAGLLGSLYSLQMQRDSGNSDTSGLILFQQFSTEKVRQLRGKTLSVSFAAEAGANYSGGALIASFYSGTAGGEVVTMLGGSAGFATGGVTGSNINMGTPTTTAARLSGNQTYTVPDDALDLAFRIFWTPTGTAGAADYVRIADVRVATGLTEVTPYDLQADWQECERFIQSSFPEGTSPAQNVGTGTGELRFPAITAAATTQRPPSVRFTTPMRAVPTITFYNPAASNAQARDLTAPGDCSSTTSTNVTTKGFDITTVGNASTAAGNTIGVHWLADASL